MKERVKAIVRLLIALLPAINIVLVYFKMSPLPFDEDEVNMAASAVIEFLGILWAWWKNNNITLQAQLAQDILNDFKENKEKVGGEVK